MSRVGSFVIKCEPDEDRYIYWSDMVEAPHAMSGREAMIDYLVCYHDHAPGKAEERLARADRTGTSAMINGWLTWEDESGPIFEQRGCVPRAKLWEFCALIMADERDKAYDLMTPFEDVGEVRRW